MTKHEHGPSDFVEGCISIVLLIVIVLIDTFMRATRK